jgi:DNA (cytosine-5)-methyltransferase 1
VTKFDGTEWRGEVDVVSGGFPCQPWSQAGQRKGAADERNLWPDTLRVLREVRPRYGFLENVPALLYASHGYFGTVLGGLAEIGYDAVWEVIPASAIGAPHRRDRLWILAHTEDPG